ncbi:4-hydroxy-3-methylbut-2-en-1-yl diphosphate synthase [Flaviaesturariibacter flavus]|uniref:4-hydroxy-3-methylbut-2-en-1-yl diphosphate synthase (flavodoxin) n=1 Tax=Flaviaesturariibacter flavus TaxID=2502780 RepID=A0A4R1BB19_9BACT|nr:(E)-4-hydroxy-3-methylbut-2-enyl-diphosphate synthase [Flaviaesturariibacter flavus]TCJ14153.1 4-hydroxy-3-methylbut-2-en-1-yl diphosphate synthase [Flaviaesturariibacter flavus]
MQYYTESLTSYKRLKTRPVRIGDLWIGGHHPIRVQTMTTTDTMDTLATVEQTIRCIEAGAELVRITAPSKKEAENLKAIRDELHRRGYNTPLVADIHFTPNAAEIAARIVEKVRVNPGNYVDKKKFETIDYTDAEYATEIDRIRERFTPLVRICKEHGTAMRIGTNHGSLSDRIMSRYGDTPMGMVESAMEFLRIARAEDYHQVVLSMKSSNPQVMVQAYRLLIRQMQEEFGECYPLHLGVTEAGDGEEGRIKSAIGIGTLLEDGIGDTIRVSLTEDPELEIPVCKDLVKRYTVQEPPPAPPEGRGEASLPLGKGLGDGSGGLTYDPYSYKRRASFAVTHIGGHNVPVVIADLSKLAAIAPADLRHVGYSYNEATDKWAIADTAADFIFTGHLPIGFALPGTLRVIQYPATWEQTIEQHAIEAEDVLEKYFPIFDDAGFASAMAKSATLNFVMLDAHNDGELSPHLEAIANDPSVVLCVSSTNKNAVQSVRRLVVDLDLKGVRNPVVLITDSNWQTADEHLVHFGVEAGALLLDGIGDGICLGMSAASYAVFDQYNTLSGRRYTTGADSAERFLNHTAFSILQATRTRISKTEYISCPSCGRTLFDLQETTAKIRAVTNHLKGVKIAIMGCIVNGPGEMADADFGYVGSGPGKITLYQGREVVKRNVPSEVAVEELINLLKEAGAWVEPAGVMSDV